LTEKLSKDLSESEQNVIITPVHNTVATSDLDNIIEKLVSSVQKNNADTLLILTGRNA